MKAKRELSKPFSVAELPKIKTPTQAQSRLDVIQQATLTGRITHNQSTAATKAVSEWIRAYQVGLTEELVSKLRVALGEKEKEIDALKRQLARTPSRSAG